MASDKNEILFQKFGTNYNNEPEIYRKGSVVYRQVSDRSKNSRLTPLCCLLIEVRFPPTVSIGRAADRPEAAERLENSARADRRRPRDDVEVVQGETGQNATESTGGR